VQPADFSVCSLIFAFTEGGSISGVRVSVVSAGVQVAG